ncbi:MAG TPA: hypothetical protein VEU54_07750 [Steroidobacteraceae bacterium]|jgi:hypothetical protein|nr:hypothetical protein [Steroidobacteraceae bacterium]
MRFAVGMLTCLSVAGLTLALADPLADTSQSASTVTASAPVMQVTQPGAAAPAAASATPLKPAVNPEEQSLMAQGYKPEIRHGKRVFCRRETALGSRLDVVKVCGTVEELKEIALNSKDVARDVQRSQLNPEQPLHGAMPGH